MTELEYALTRFGEECNEVSQEVSKVICFTPDHSYKEGEPSNADRLKAEFLQLLGMALVVQGLGVDLGLGEVISSLPYESQKEINLKIFKYNRYLEISRKLGVKVE